MIMKIFPGTDLPDDFVRQVMRLRKLEQPGDPNATWNAIVAVLGRPLNGAEKIAFVDALHAGRIDSASFGTTTQASPVHT
jgi:hypothetical protein